MVRFSSMPAATTATIPEHLGKHARLALGELVAMSNRALLGIGPQLVDSTMSVLTVATIAVKPRWR